MMTLAAFRSVDTCLSSSPWAPPDSPPEVTALMCLARAWSVAKLVKIISTRGNTSLNASEVEANTDPCCRVGNSQMQPSKGLVVQLITISSTVVLPWTWVVYTRAGIEKARLTPHTSARTIHTRLLSLCCARGPKVTCCRLRVVQWKMLSARVTQQPTALHHTQSSMKTRHQPGDRDTFKPRSDTKIGTVRKSEVSRLASDRCTRIVSEGASLRDGLSLAAWTTWN